MDSVVKLEVVRKDSPRGKPDRFLIGKTPECDYRAFKVSEEGTLLHLYSDVDAKVIPISNISSWKVTEGDGKKVVV